MENIKALHTSLLEIMDEIHQICVTHDIQYMLLAGSMLGAIRHEGFIPWDDDLDIGMKRSDYEIFKTVIKDHLSEKFYYIDMHNHDQYALPFIKIMKRNTMVQEKSAPNDMKDYGVFVDVFPLDAVPSDEKQEKRHRRKTSISQKRLLAKCQYRLDLHEKPIKKIVYGMLRLSTIFTSKEKLACKLERQMMEFNHENTDTFVNIGGSYSYDKEKIKLEWIKNLKLYSFEGRKYFGTSLYHDYLTALYGDYMELPHEDDRIPRHSFEKIKL